MSEDRFVTPVAWRRRLLPRRGGAPVAYEPARDALRVVDKALRELTGARESLDDPATPPDVAAAGLAQLDGAPGSAPLGAAAVAAMLTDPSERRKPALGRALADAWVLTRGLPFAAGAAVELADLRHSRNGAAAAPILRHGRDRPPGHWQDAGVTVLLDRLRAAMAAAGDDDYAAAVAALGAMRAGRLEPHQSAVASFLAPAETAWVKRDIGLLGGARGQEWPAVLLTTCVTAPGQARTLLNGSVLHQVVDRADLTWTLAEGLAEEGLPVFLELLDSLGSWQPDPAPLLSAIAAVPNDAAFLALLARCDERAWRRALQEAAERFPRRALRLLSAAPGGGPGAAFAGDLLRGVVAGNRELADEVAAGLPEAPARRIAAITAGLDAVAEAPAEALPPLLADPPWAGSAKSPKPAVIAGLACADPVAIEWAPGERDAWLRFTRHAWLRHGRDYNRTAEDLRAGRTRSVYDLVGFFLGAPEELAAPLLARWRPGDVWGAEDWLRGLVARFGVAAYPVVVAAAPHGAAAAAGALQPFTGPEVAPLMAEWLVRLKSVRPAATAWLRRHPAAAARGLIPAALGRRGPARHHAERALHLIAGAGHRAAVEEAAAGYGAPAAAAVAALLDTDPAHMLPARMPAVPAWADPAVLAPVELAGGAGSLPAGAVRHLVTMLALSRIGEPYAGLAATAAACTSASLAEFAWTLFRQWQHAGSPSKESWALDALGLLGDDGTVRRLAPVIRAWPGEGGHARAVAGLDVLAEIGTDVALMHLHGIAEKVRFRALKERAQEKIAEVAAGLGLSPEQLADRLVPDFGLAADGTLLLDYGPRRFVVGFDEQLRPQVADEDGRRRRELPKPGAKDDPELAPAAARRFAALKKDVRTVAADQIRRFERAMVTQRRRTPEEFRRCIVEHPLVWHVARRLVWAAYDDAGAVVATLRVAEDRSLAGAGDEAAVIPAGATVGVAHPLQLGAALAGWADVFADYEILQPFPQLGRDTHELTPEERVATVLTRADGVKVPTTKVLGLERRGWRRAAPQDAGFQPAMERDLPWGDTLMLDLNPGIVVGDVTTFGEQVLGEAYVLPDATTSWDRRHARPLGAVDPVTMSEILRDLREVAP